MLVLVLVVVVDVQAYRRAAEGTACTCVAGGELAETPPPLAPRTRPAGMLGLGVVQPGQLALLTGSSHLHLGVTDKT